MISKVYLVPREEVDQSGGDTSQGKVGSVPNRARRIRSLLLFDCLLVPFTFGGIESNDTVCPPSEEDKHGDSTYLPSEASQSHQMTSLCGSQISWNRVPPQICGNSLVPGGRLELCRDRHDASNVVRE